MDGTYAISAPVLAEGVHDLQVKMGLCTPYHFLRPVDAHIQSYFANDQVRLAYRRWVPRLGCREVGCREVYDIPDSANMTKEFPYITKRIVVSLGSSTPPLDVDVVARTDDLPVRT